MKNDMRSNDAPRRVPVLAFVAVSVLLLGGVVLAGLGGLWTQRSPLVGQSQPAGMAKAPFGVQPTPTLPANLPAPLVQTHNGYTVAIQPLAADANQVVISYTVSTDSSVARQSFWILLATLADPAAKTLPATQRTVIHPGLSQPLVFERDGLTDLAAESHLQLTVNLALLPPSAPALPPAPPTGVILGAPPFTPVPTLPRIPPPTATPPPDPPLPTVGPPFQFALTLPTDRRVRAISPAQSVTVQGITLTLDRVVMAASETRIWLHSAAAASVNRSGLRFFGQLQATGSNSGNQSVPLYLDGQLRPLDDTRYMLTQPGSLLDHTGEWNLTVKDDRPYHTINTALPDTGPTLESWSFRFTLPPLAAP